MTSEWAKFKAENRRPKPSIFSRLSVERVSDEVAEARYATCLECPELSSITKQCAQCACFMAVKVRFVRSTCPLNKWVQ